MKRFQHIQISATWISGVIFLFLLGFLACDNPDIDPQNYTEKLYEDGSSYSLRAIDMQQTGDGGYIILGERNESSPYLMKLSKEGVREWAVWDEAYGKPVRSLLIAEDGYVFFAQEDTVISLVKVSANVGDNGAQNFQLVGKVEYPDAPTADIDSACVPFGRAFPTALYSIYNPNTRAFLLTGDETFDQVTWLAEVPLDKPEDAIFGCNPYKLEEISQNLQGDPETARNKLFGGYYPWTNDCCYYFTTFSNDPDNGIDNNVFLQFLKDDLTSLDLGFPAEFVTDIQGVDNPGSTEPRYNLATGSETFSTVLYDFSITSSGENINTQLEMDGSSRNQLLKIDDLRYVFAGKSHNNQLVLLAYNGPKLLNKTFLGSGNPYEVAELINTSDGGVAIAANTFVGSRFPRIAFFKLSKEQVDELLKE